MTDDRLVVETPRLRLRPVSVADAPAAFEWSSDPEATRFVSFATHKEIAETVAYIQLQERRMSESSYVMWAIVIKATAEIAGVFQVRVERKDAEVGFIIAARHWSKGIVSEALLAAVVFAQNSLGAERVHGVCNAENVASMRVFEKCGFRGADAAPAVFPNISTEPCRRRIFTYDL